MTETLPVVGNILADSKRAELLRACDLIIRDELPMAHRFTSAEALDPTLQDLIDDEQPFGSKMRCIQP